MLDSAARTKYYGSAVWMDLKHPGAKFERGAARSIIAEYHADTSALDADMASKIRQAEDMEDFDGLMQLLTAAWKECGWRWTGVPWITL